MASGPDCRPDPHARAASVALAKNRSWAIAGASACHRHAQLKSRVFILRLTKCPLIWAAAPVTRGGCLSIANNRTSFPTIVKSFHPQSLAVCHCPDVSERSLDHGPGIVEWSAVSGIRPAAEGERARGSSKTALAGRCAVRHSMPVLAALRETEIRRQCS